MGGRDDMEIPFLFFSLKKVIIHIILWCLGEGNIPKENIIVPQTNLFADFHTEKQLVILSGWIASLDCHTPLWGVLSIAFVATMFLHHQPTWSRDAWAQKTWDMRHCVTSDLSPHTLALFLAKICSSDP